MIISDLEILAEQDRDKAASCPSTHCGRAEECRSPHECASAKKTWGDVFWIHIAAGCDRSDAAYRADQWEARHAR